MRQCEVYKIQKNPNWSKGDSLSQKYERVLDFTGLFHCFSTDYDEFNDGPAMRPVAIIELSDGTIEIVNAGLIRFIDPMPADKTEDEMCMELKVRKKMIENDTWYKCNVCGREGRVGRCCSDEDRTPLNALAKAEQERIKGDYTKPEEIEMELSEAVKSKLAEAVQLWADENLPGRPATLGYAVYLSVEGELLKKQKEVEEKFPR